MNDQLIKQLIADASNDKIGMRIRAVIDAVVSAAVYAYTAGLIAADKWSAFVLWYEQVWVGQSAANKQRRSTSAPVENPGSFVSDPTVDTVSARNRASVANSQIGKMQHDQPSATKSQIGKMSPTIVENSTPDTTTTLQVSPLAPIKNKRRRAVGFAN